MYRHAGQAGVPLLSLPILPGFFFLFPDWFIVRRTSFVERMTQSGAIGCGFVEATDVGSINFWRFWASLLRGQGGTCILASKHVRHRSHKPSARARAS
jgi:hypothetical protein|mmetsp:Transcript_65139/g.104659  ORF Transcript_65139/g.104659 Transcript_65139/m.104659 type:complete len:98 (+) Transcript_65139:152-445(+)